MATLFHYTTPAGLQGIIESKTIWASEYRFLNDATEFSYGLQIFEEVLQGEKRRLNAVTTEIAETITSLLTRAPELYVFITSLSEKGDLLSQWRGYTNGAGFAVGFNADWINQNAEAQGFKLIPVRYSRSDHVAIVSGRLTLLINMINDAQSRGRSNVSEIIHEWWPLMLSTIPAIKNDHFFEEKEMRLVKVVESWPDTIETRHGPSGLTPYMRFKLNAHIIDHSLFKPENFGIESITLGPALHERQILAVKALLTSKTMSVSVEKSDIPYIAS